MSVGIFARILNPPNAVSNLVASPVGSQDGDVQLVWTAPANANGQTMDRYRVRFASYPAPSIGQAETWWSTLAASERTIAPAHAAGVTEFATVSGLPLGVTWYFGIKAVDRDESVSGVDIRTGTPQQAKSLALVLGSPPNAPPTLTGVAQSTGSILWQWGVTASATYYTLYEDPGGGFVVQTPLLQNLETGFGPNTLVSRTVRAGNIYGISPPRGPTSVYTLAAIPTSLGLNFFSNGGASLGWSANGNPANTSYLVERSADNVTFGPLIPNVSTPSFTDSGLSAATSYYYRVRAFNGDGIQTSTSATLTVYTPEDMLRPRAPLGLKGTVSTSGQNFSLIWEAVTHNEDSTLINDLVGYRIYRSTGVLGPRVLIATAPLTQLSFGQTTSGQTFYYTIRAVDARNNESEDSLIADSSSQANVIYIAPDGASFVKMPVEVNNLLRSGFNKYGVALTLRLTEEPVPSDGTVIRSLRLLLVRGDTLAPVDGLAFPKSHVTISIGYNIINGEVAPGAPSAFPPPAMAGVIPTDLAIFWNNGFSWIKLGGTLDPVAQTVSIRTAVLGEYQLRAAPRSSALTLDRASVYPRVFTPNGDGLNDRVYFVLDNPNDAVVRGEIFDRDGRAVATLADPSASTGIGTTLTWDGRDALGNVVPGGAYIYRIKGEGRVFTGTVGVAR